MGWDWSHYANKAALVERLTESFETKDSFRTCIAKKSTYGVLWTVWQVVDKNTGKAKRFIGCDLIKGSKGYYGYKSMCEMMGPCYYSCPLEFFDLVEDPQSKYAVGWRDEVRAYHAQIEARRVRTFEDDRNRFALEA